MGTPSRRPRPQPRALLPGLHPWQATFTSPLLIACGGSATGLLISALQTEDKANRGRRAARGPPLWGDTGQGQPQLGARVCSSAELPPQRKGHTLHRLESLWDGRTLSGGGGVLFADRLIPFGPDPRKGPWEIQLPCSFCSEAERPFLWL